MKTINEMAETCNSESAFRELCAVVGFDADEQIRIHAYGLKCPPQSESYWRFIAQRAIKA